MAATVEPVDVMELLARMRPGLDQTGDDWPPEERQAVVEWVLARPGCLGRRGRWIVEGAAIAAAAAGVVFLIPGVWDATHSVPAAPVPAVSFTSVSAPATLTCRTLDDRERNDVGKMNQTYRGVDPDDGVVDSAAVDAGAGYRVIGTRLTTGRSPPGSPG